MYLFQKHGDEYKKIAKSKLFDKKWYLKTYPNVAVAKVDPVDHYLKYGWKEGKNPSPLFDGNKYISAYPDVKYSNMNPLLHYEKFGKKENRIIVALPVSAQPVKTKTVDKKKIIAKSKYFDKKWYLQQNKDVAASKKDPVEHYLKYGWKEGRNPGPFFDGNKYLAKYPDVKAAKINPLLHYELFGKNENRQAILGFTTENKRTKSKNYKIIAKSKLFDKKWYLKTYPNVAAAKVDPVDHYLKYGWKEGKNPGPLFDVKRYYAKYPDIKDANMNPLVHYELYGKKEHRVVVPVITPKLEQDYIEQFQKVVSLMQQEKKAVLFAHELTVTGAPYALLKIARILKSQNWDVLIVSPVNGPLATTIKKENIPLIIASVVADLNISVYQQMLNGFSFALCNTVVLTELALKIQNVLPTLLYIHEAAEGLQDITTKAIFEQRNDMLRNIKNVACVSPFARSFYLPYNSNVKLIRNFAEIDFDSVVQNQSSNKVRFCYVGALTALRKNVPLLIQCFEKLYKENKNVELHLIGDKNTVLGKQLKSKKIKNVFFHGEVVGAKKHKLFSKMDIFVVPSVYESCSLVVLEAAAHKRGVIISETVGAKYLVKNGESGLICKTDSADSLYKAMKKVANNPDLITTFSKNIADAYEKYAVKSVTEQDLMSCVTESESNFNTERKNKLTIIVPIYNAADKIGKCIDSVLKHTKLSGQTQLLLIDDCSPDKDVKKVLSKYKDHKFVTIVRNKENLGYTKNINKAIKFAKHSDVILLNSDTIVTKNWVKKITDAAYLSPSIGTVTPVSNSAGAFSVPKAGANLVSPFLKLDGMADLVEKTGKNYMFDVPTGNGFCLFIKRAVFDKIGLFDDVNFPVGYGEENDFCMRVKKAGFLNTVILNTYIFHHEHASFSTRSDMLMKNGIERIKKIYPDYLDEIHVFGDNVIFNKVKSELQNTIDDTFEQKIKRSNMKFSFIMPTYNRAFCICRAIDSLLGQTYQNFELIICDDGSTDDTEQLIQIKYGKELANKKIVYLKSGHVGVCGARNIAMQHATGEWIAYLDSDNYIISNYLETFVSYIMGYPEYKTFCAKMLVENTNVEIGHDFDRKQLEQNNFIDLGVFVHHRSLMDKYGLFDTNLKRLVDWDLILRYTKKYPPLYINKTVLTYCINSNFARISNNIYCQPHYLSVYKKHGLFSGIKITTMITTYNHEKYIARAIESAIKQTGNFEHEILISDDCSTDNTRNIIKEYAQKYPDIIKDISSKKNMGISANMKKCFKHATGKYIAVLEGDDYWTDAQKLQKQMEFLENNKGCSMVFSKIKIINNKTGKTYFLDRQQNLSSLLTGEDVIKEPSLNLIGNFSCCMFVTKYMKELPSIMFTGRLNEISVSFYLEQKGYIGFISTPLSVYNQHENGVWTGATRQSQLESGLKARQVAAEVCAKKYKPILRKIIKEQFVKPLKELGVKL